MPLGVFLISVVIVEVLMPNSFLLYFVVPKLCNAKIKEAYGKKEGRKRDGRRGEDED